MRFPLFFLILCATVDKNNQGEYIDIHSSGDMIHLVPDCRTQTVSPNPPTDPHNS